MQHNYQRPESEPGCWYNKETKEELYPDLKDSLPVPPHWDYKKGAEERMARLFLDGTWQDKRREKIETRTIIRLDLDFEKSLNYFTDYIRYDKTLPKFILDKINFKRGSFFTLLPNNLVISQLYQFTWGGIICTIPGEETYTVNDKEFCPQQVITMTGELVESLFSFLNKDLENYVLLENVLADASDPGLKLDDVELFSNRGEVYYLLKNGNSTKQISETINISSAAWRFLAIAGNNVSKILKINKEIDFDNVCKYLNYIIVGAYDSEGYIFWENNQYNPMLSLY